MKGNSKGKSVARRFPRGFFLLPAILACAQQLPDPDFPTAVEHPAYTKTHPKVVFDEAHSNFHTAGGRYKPLADMLRSDGYDVAAGTLKFAKGGLKSVRVLLISNALGQVGRDTSTPAFTEQECDVVRDWVRGGGSLLLIADHTPFGAAAETLAKRFGVEMGKGYAFDRVNSEGNPTVLVFSRENRLLGEHAVVHGRGGPEEVRRVVAFTGQSLSVPKGASALMRLGPGAWESPNNAELQAALAEKEPSAAHARPVPGLAQGIAMRFGKGRVVMVGEAAMFSAQVGRFEQNGKKQEFKMGMNVPGNDDRQFALNVLHWLSGLLKSGLLK